MKEILTEIIERLVTNKTAVLITETVSGERIMFEIEVAESDMGKIIGKEGRIAKAIRIVMKSIAAEEGKDISVEFIG